MKLLIIIDSLAIGGAQKHVRQLACGLAARGHSLEILVLNPVVDASYREPLEASGVKITQVGLVKLTTGFAWVETAWRIRHHRCDAVLTFLFYSSVFGRLVAQLAGGVPVINCLQARNINYPFWKNVSLRLTAGLSVWTASNSEAALRWASSREGVRLNQSSIVENAVEFFDGVVPDWTALGVPDLSGRFVIGSFGRLDAQKGYDVLLSAVGRLEREEREKLALVVFGEGPERKALTGQREKLGLTNCVFFPGANATAPAALSRFDLYVQPSRFEGTPNAVMEALAAEVKVVASRTDGVCEIDAPPRALRLVERNDVAALAEIIREEVNGDRNRPPEKSYGARNGFIQRYSVARLCDTYETLCVRLVFAREKFVAGV